MKSLIVTSLLIAFSATTYASSPGSEQGVFLPIDEWNQIIDALTTSQPHLAEMPLPEIAGGEWEMEKIKEADRKADAAIAESLNTLRKIGGILKDDVKLVETSDGGMRLGRGGQYFRDIYPEMNELYLQAILRVTDDETRWENARLSLGYDHWADKQCRRKQSRRGTINPCYERNFYSVYTRTYLEPNNPYNSNPFREYQSFVSARAEALQSYLRLLNQQIEFAVVDRKIGVFVRPWFEPIRFSAVDAIREWMGENIEHSLWIAGLVSGWYGLVKSAATVANAAVVVTSVVNVRIVNADLELVPISEKRY